MRTSLAFFFLLVGLTCGLQTRAAVDFYSDYATFMTHVQAGSYTETFESLPLSGSGESPPGLPSPHSFSSTPYSYSVASSAGYNLWVTSVSGNQYLGTGNSPEHLVLTFNNSNISAFGGYFFNLNSGNLPVGDVRIQLSDGTSQLISNPTASTFVGFVATSPLSSATVQWENVSVDAWVNMNDLIVGTAQVPEPAITGLLAALVPVGAIITIQFQRRISRRRTET